MTITQAKRLFNKFVITWNDTIQKSGDIYFGCKGDFPDILLPATKEELNEAFNLLIQENPKDEMVKNYHNAIKLLDHFSPLKK